MGTGRRGFARDVAESLLIAVVLALVIRLFIFQPFYIPSGSMEPTLLIDDRIIVSKVAYYFSEPQRGDVIVFKYPRDPERVFVKRLIGRGGESVAIKDNHLYINNELIQEDYLPNVGSYVDFGPVQIPENKYFVLGDNRTNSDDSRVWGSLEEELLIGKAVAVYWPMDRIGGIE